MPVDRGASSGQGSDQDVDPIAVGFVEVPAQSERPAELHRDEAVRERRDQSGGLQRLLGSDQPLGQRQQRRDGEGVLFRGWPRTWGQVHEQELVRSRRRVGEGSIRVGGRADAGLGVDRRSVQVHLSSQLVEGLHDDRGDQGAAVREPLVERRGPDADSLGDRLHRDRVEAAGLEQRSAGGDDLRSGCPCPRGTHAFARPIRPRCVSWNELGSFKP